MTRDHVAVDERETGGGTSRNEERFRIMADSSPIMIWATDAAGDVEFVNRAYTEFFGVTVEDVRGPGWQPLVHPEDAEGYVAEFFSAMAERRSFRCKTRVLRHDGSWRWIDSFGVPRLGPGGEFLGCVGSSPDITELVEARAEAEAARAEAEAANQLRDEAIAMISHELRTPMTTIAGWTAMLARGAVDEATLPLAVESLQASSRVLQKLVDDLYDLARITGRKLTIEARPLNLVETIQTAVTLTSLGADAKKISLHVKMPNAPVLVLGDPQRLQQAVANLLANAVKFTPPAGEVHVILVAEGDEVSITVRDTGRGMPAEFLPRVFERFTQQERGGGLGLGLAITKEIVDLHGGVIEAHSAGPGQGATLIVRLRALKLPTYP